jgi:hypothetical protein
MCITSMYLTEFLLNGIIAKQRDNIGNLAVCSSKDRLVEALVD